MIKPAMMTPTSVKPSQREYTTTIVETILTVCSVTQNVNEDTQHSKISTNGDGWRRTDMMV